MPPSTEGEDNVPPLVREALERYLAVQPERVTRLERITVELVKHCDPSALEDDEYCQEKAEQIVAFARRIDQELAKAEEGPEF